ncbi:MAG: TatD family hydrolase [Kiritimatiellia bacterium]
MFDAHLHLRDARIIPYHERFVKEAIEAGVTAAISCASRPEEWCLQVDCAMEIYNAYGVHPWFAGVLIPDWKAYLSAILDRDEQALIGEIGIDGIRSVSDGGAMQRALLSEQLDLARHYQRPVILHGARAWSFLFQAIETKISHLPALMLHGASFAVEMLQMPIFKHQNIWFSVGNSLLSSKAESFSTFIQALPLNRLLIETDAPDMFPRGGEPLVLGQPHALYNHPGNLHYVLEAIARLRAIPVEELAQITEANARAFIAAR